MRHPFLFASDTTSTIVRRKRAKSSTISSNPAQFDDFIDEKRHFRRLFVDLKNYVTKWAVSVTDSVTSLFATGSKTRTPQIRAPHKGDAPQIHKNHSLNQMPYLSLSSAGTSAPSRYRRAFSIRSSSV